MQPSQKITNSFILTLFTILIFAVPASADEPKEQGTGSTLTGEQIYRKQCIGCHGEAGKGSMKFKKSLTGDLSVGQLTKLIDETMPEENPDECVGEDARKVAEYIYESFYSPTAQARNKPPRVEMVRLTVGQYQNALMDLIGSFRPSGQTAEMKGLKGEYFSSRQMRRELRVIERVDPVIAFNFGARRPHDPVEEAKPADQPKPVEAGKPKAEATKDGKPQSFGPLELALADPPQKSVQKSDQEKKPAPANADKPNEQVKKVAAPQKDAAKNELSEEELKKKIEEQKRLQREREKKQREEQKKKDEEAKQFSVRWQGSVFPTESGEFEFVVRTDNAFRLWVNDNEKPLIDAWVKSGTDREFRQSIRLLGGRGYIIRLEMFKFREPTAAIELAWKRPGMSHVEPITDRHLSPTWNPRRFVIQTPFPPDDRSFGYERGIAISKAWESATTDGAIETANLVVASLNELAGAKADEEAESRNKKIREFAAKFVERAFRRPLSPEQKKLYVDRQFETIKDPEQALRRVILLTLKSPRFLYLESNTGEADAYDIASRISFALWDSLPDTNLLEAVAKGNLANPEQWKSQAQRMVKDPRAAQKLRDFLHAWLRLEGSPDLTKDPKVFADFTPEVIGDLRTSLEMTLDDFVKQGQTDFRQLLTADSWYANDRLAKIYGLKLPAGDGFRKVKSGTGDPAGRAGVMTHPYMLAMLAYTQTTSPIHRGVFLARSILGRAIKPPPIAVSPLAPDLHPNLTTRERTILQTSPAACVSCHSTINGLGFSLENYDAIGRFRSIEKDKPIDASGEYLTRDGNTVKYNGATELAKFVANTAETQSSLVQQIFHHTVKQPIMAYGTETPGKLRADFIRQGFDLRELIVQSALTAAGGSKHQTNAGIKSQIAESTPASSNRNDKSGGSD